MGRTLEEMLREGPLDPLRTARLLLQIAGALEDAHPRGAFHGALDPRTLIVEDLGGRDQLGPLGGGSPTGDLRSDLREVGVLGYRCLTRAAPSAVPIELVAPMAARGSPELCRMLSALLEGAPDPKDATALRLALEEIERALGEEEVHDVLGAFETALEQRAEPAIATELRKRLAMMRAHQPPAEPDRTGLRLLVVWALLLIGGALALSYFGGR